MAILNTVFAILGWIISLFRKPSIAESLGRTEEELAQANDVLKKVKTADDTKVLLDRISADAVRDSLQKYTRTD